jgi:hypothetical protein
MGPSIHIIQCSFVGIYIFFLTQSLEKMLSCPKHFFELVGPTKSTPKKLPKIYYVLFSCGIDPYLQGKL